MCELVNFKILLNFEILKSTAKTIVLAGKFLYSFGILNKFQNIKIIC